MNHWTKAPDGVDCSWSDGDSLANGTAIRCDRDGNPLVSAKELNWKRFKKGDYVKGRHYTSDELFEGEIVSFDESGACGAHWAIADGNGFKRYLKDDSLEFAERPKAPAPAPKFLVWCDKAVEPHVTEFFLEQANESIRIVAKRAGESQIVACIGPDDVTGKATLRRVSMGHFNTLQVESDGRRIKMR